MMNETTLKRNFRKWFDKFDPNFKFKDKTVSKIIPKSIEKGNPVYRRSNYKSLIGKQIIAQYSKTCNVVWILTKQTSNRKYAKILPVYEIYAIEPENVVAGIFGPILYKVL